MKIGIAQMNSQDNKSINLINAEKHIERLVMEGAELIVLPEYFNFLGSEEQERENAEPINGESLNRIKKKAIQYKVYICIGSFLERENNNIYNTSIVFDIDGEIIAKYRKIHLFDVNNPGSIVHMESKIITPGQEVTVFKIKDITFGIATCYDLRFPEIFRKLLNLGAEVFLLPAAFHLETGRDHWEVLLRARAIENLAYVIAAAQWGFHPINNTCYGHSMAINPWGTILAQAADGVSNITVNIDKNTIIKIRDTFPVLKHRRSDIFGI